MGSCPLSPSVTINWKIQFVLGKKSNIKTNRKFTSRTNPITMRILPVLLALHCSLAIELDSEQKEFIIGELRALSGHAKNGSKITEFGLHGFSINVMDPEKATPEMINQIVKMTIIFQPTGQIDFVDTAHKKLETLMSVEGDVDENILLKIFNPDQLWIEENIKKIDPIMKQIKMLQKQAENKNDGEPLEKTLYTRKFTIFSNKTVLVETENGQILSRFEGEIDFDHFNVIFPQDVLTQVEVVEDEPTERNVGIHLMKVDMPPRTISSGQKSGKEIMMLPLIASLAWYAIC